jgi:hypothetical protein
MLDAGLRVTFRHFWTFFFVAAVVTVPLHLIYVFTWHDVIGLRELAPQIQHLPPSRHVHLVGASDLRQARIALWVLDVVELALLPLAIRAGRAVVTADERGEVPTATRAWRDAFVRQERAWLHPGAGLLAGVLIGVAVGCLIDAIGRAIAEPLGVDWAYAVLGLTQGSARAVGAAFLLGVSASDPSAAEASV